MAQLKTLLPLIVVLGAMALFAYLYQPPAATPTMTTTLRIGTTTIVAEVADTTAEHERGLGGRTTLAEGAGMWFVFKDDGMYPFWMKDTLIPLDMLWVAADGTIVTIAHDAQPDSYPQVYEPTSPARYVLEVPGGYAKKQGIAEGMKVVVQ
jgi:uncharacterized membrane protein (UPF0127 family)